MAALKDVLAAFSPRGDQFVITAGDGRVKTWDVTTGHISAEFNEITAGSSALTSEGHLDLEYKTLAWGGATKKSKKKGSLIALGTGSGDVLAWNPVLGELKWRSNDVHSGGVHSICFAKDHESLYSSGADGIICEIEIASGQVLSRLRGSKSAVSSIALSPDGSRLLAASSELKLFDMSSRRRIRKFTGHASSVAATAFTGDGRYALSAAVGDRHVAVWDCDGSAKGALFVLAMEHPAVALDSWGFGKDGKAVKVLAVSEVGEAYVWGGKDMEELAKSSPVRITIAPNNPAKSSSTQCIILGRILGSESILVARGTTVKPDFEKISLGEQFDNIVLPASQQGSLLASQSAADTTKGGRDDEVTVLGGDNSADASLIKSRVEIGELKKRKRPAAQEPDKPSEKPNESVRGNSDEAVPMIEDNDEQTMEERLMALGLVEDRPSEGNALKSVEIVPPKSDTLDVLLRQALQADDNNLLEHCFEVSDEKVITNTMRLISGEDACKLLRLTIPKVEARPRRALLLIPWLRAALVEHATYIISNKNMDHFLEALHEIIGSRLYVMKPLLALSGRLDLIMAKIKESESSKPSGEAEVAAVYEEEDSDQDVEDAMEDEEEDDEEEETGAQNARADDMQEDKPLENGGGFSDDDDSDQSE